MAKGSKSILYINSKKVAEGRVEKTVPGCFGIDTFGVGEDTVLCLPITMLSLLLLHWQKY